MGLSSTAELRNYLAPPCPSSRLESQIYSVRSPGWRTAVQGQEEERTGTAVPVLSWTQLVILPVSGTVASADRKGWSSLCGRCLNSTPSQPRHILFTPMPVLSSRIPHCSVSTSSPLPSFENPGLMLIIPGHPAPSLHLQTKCLLPLKPIITLFPCSLTCILTGLFRVASGLLAAKPNDLSSAKYGALASLTWTLP